MQCKKMEWEAVGWRMEGAERGDIGGEKEGDITRRKKRPSRKNPPPMQEGKKERRREERSGEERLEDLIGRGEAEGGGA